MERICPKNGSICPAQLILEAALLTARTDVERKTIADSKYGVAGAVMHQAHDGRCEGPLKEDDGHAVHIRCGNGNDEAMKHVYDNQREARAHIVELPEEILYVTRNE